MNTNNNFPEIGSQILLRRGGHDSPAPGQYRMVKAIFLEEDGEEVCCKLEQDDPDAVGYCTKKDDIGWWSKSIMHTPEGNPINTDLTPLDNPTISEKAISSENLFGSWMPMNTAPKERPILVFHAHFADPYYCETENRLTVYGSHCEDGKQIKRNSVEIAEWGGEWDDRTYEEPNAGWMPDWWFKQDSEGETPLNPIAWMDLPLPPNVKPE